MTDLPSRKVTQKDIDYQEAVNRGRLAERITDAVTYVAMGIVAVFFLFALKPIVALLAGKDTQVSVTLTVSLTVTLVPIGVAWRRHQRKDREQAEELRRVRARLQDYEDDSLQ